MATITTPVYSPSAAPKPMTINSGAVPSPSETEAGGEQAQVERPHAPAGTANSAAPAATQRPRTAELKLAFIKRIDMNSDDYFKLRGELKRKIEAIDTRRTLLRAIIVSFAEQLDKHLGIEGKHVQVGTQQQDGAFTQGAFEKAENGGFDFDIQIRFDVGNGQALYPCSRLNIQLDEQQQAFIFTAEETGNLAVVPAAVKMEGAFTGAFHLVQPGIEVAVAEFLKRQ